MNGTSTDYNVVQVPTSHFPQDSSFNCRQLTSILTVSPFQGRSGDTGFTVLLCRHVVRRYRGRSTLVGGPYPLVFLTTVKGRIISLLTLGREGVQP